MANLKKMLVLALFIAGCSGDNSGVDAESACNEGLCATDQSRQDACVEAVYTCLENEPDLNDDECVVLGLRECRI